MTDVFLAEDDKYLIELRELAPAGFVVALNVNWSGPQILHSEFDPQWRKEYEDKNYFILDPVFYWTITNRGGIRWSEIKLPDVAKVAHKASEYGMKYGAVFSVRESRNRSFLTAARPDREFTEPEMDRLNTIFQHCISTLLPTPNLTDKELDTVRSIQSGKTTSEAASDLGISENDVKSALESAMKKLDVKNRPQLIATLVARGLV